MKECPDGSFEERTRCILLYNGSTRDVWINYIMLSIVTLPLAVVRARRVVTDDSGNGSPRSHEKYVGLWWILASVAFLLGVSLFQIVLCWCLGCAGVSIIWCAIVGWIVNERQEQQKQQKEKEQGQQRHHSEQSTTNDEQGEEQSVVDATQRPELEKYEDLVLTTVLAVLLYYAVTSPIITTVAHGCALILGSLGSRLVRRSVYGKPSTTGYDVITDPLVT